MNVTVKLLSAITAQDALAETFVTLTDASSELVALLHVDPVIDWAGTEIEHPLSHVIVVWAIVMVIAVVLVGVSVHSPLVDTLHVLVVPLTVMVQALAAPQLGVPDTLASPLATTLSEVEKVAHETLTVTPNAVTENVEPARPVVVVAASTVSVALVPAPGVMVTADAAEGITALAAAMTSSASSAVRVTNFTMVLSGRVAECALVGTRRRSVAERDVMLDRTDADTR